jgi:hypothetical protein
MTMRARVSGVGFHGDGKETSTRKSRRAYFRPEVSLDSAVHRAGFPLMELQLLSYLASTNNGKSQTL